MPEINALVDLATLRDGLRDRGVCETDNGTELPVSTVRRLYCDADVIPIVLNGDGQPVDVGRTQRTATPAQRRALRAMYATCAHPDGTVGFTACRIHHIRWWWQHGGRTDLENLIPHSANSTTTSSTKADGPSLWRPTEPRNGPDPTAPWPSMPHRRPATPDDPDGRTPPMSAQG